MSEIRLIEHTHNIEYVLPEFEYISYTEKKDNIRLKLFVCVIVFPAVSGIIGYFIPLEFSVLLAVLIGFLDIIWFIK